MVTIRKVDLPDEIKVEKDGVKFVFERPSNLDVFDAHLVRDGNDMRYIFGKLRRIEGLKFPDGSEVKRSHAKDLDIETQIFLKNAYLEKFYLYFAPEGEQKKAQEASE